MAKKQRKIASTQRLTTGLDVEDFPGFEDDNPNGWKIQCLGLRQDDGAFKSKVMDELKEWEANNEKEYEKLLRAVRYGSANLVHSNQDLIRQDKKKRGGYEFKNTSCNCRLFFFYHHTEKRIIICTNTYWKGKGFNKADQDREFALCARMKELYTKKG